MNQSFCIAPLLSCIVNTIAILLHDHCAIYAPPPTLPVYAIHHTILVMAISHTILVMAISCKG